MTQTSSQPGEGGFELEGCSAAFLNLDKEGNCLGDLLSCAILKQLFKYLCAPHSFQEDACTYRTSSPSPWFTGTVFPLITPSSLRKQLQVPSSHLITKGPVRKVEAYNRLSPGRARKHQRRLQDI